MWYTSSTQHQVSKLLLARFKDRWNYPPVPRSYPSETLYIMHHRCSRLCGTSIEGASSGSTRCILAWELRSLAVGDPPRRLVGNDMYPGASQSPNLLLHLFIPQSVTFSSSEPSLHLPVAPSSLSLSRGCRSLRNPAILQRNLGLQIVVCCIY
jgi:hypothetical protein